MSVDAGKERDARGGSGAMFDGIAARYDFVNRVLSLGTDRGWRKKAVEALEPPAGARILDLATGTADVAIAIARRYPDATVLGIDPSKAMLEIGQEKTLEQGLAARVELVTGDAESLPVGSGTVDGITMAFGIRNVPDRAQALREMRRVLKAGARVAILELTEPRGLLGPLARFHIHTVVPQIGALLSGADEYRYLHRSIAAFPPADEFAAMMEVAGLEVVDVRPLTFGVCTLFVARARAEEEGR